MICFFIFIYLEESNWSNLTKDFLEIFLVGFDRRLNLFSKNKKDRMYIFLSRFKKDNNELSDDKLQKKLMKFFDKLNLTRIELIIAFNEEFGNTKLKIMNI